MIFIQAVVTFSRISLRILQCIFLEFKSIYRELEWIATIEKGIRNIWGFSCLIFTGFLIMLSLQENLNIRIFISKRRRAHA